MVDSGHPMGTVPVGIIMGSQSDWETMQHAAQTLDKLGIAHEARIISAHRTPKRLFDYTASAKSRGLKVIIAGAGGAAHLPGVAAAMTPIPVLGVPMQSRALQGLDSLLSMVQMPRGIPVATVAIDGARNAGLLAARILAVSDPGLRAALVAHAERLADDVRARDRALQERLDSS